VHGCNYSPPPSLVRSPCQKNPASTHTSHRPPHVGRRRARSSRPCKLGVSNRPQTSHRRTHSFRPGIRRARGSLHSRRRTDSTSSRRRRTQGNTRIHRMPRSSRDHHTRWRTCPHCRQLQTSLCRRRSCRWLHSCRDLSIQRGTQAARNLRRAIRPRTRNGCPKLSTWRYRQ